MKIVGGLDASKLDHWRNHFRECPVVKINGAVAEHVIEADDVAGYIVVAVYEGGRLKLDKTGKSIATKRIIGKVDIQPISGGERLNGS